MIGLHPSYLHSCFQARISTAQPSPHSTWRMVYKHCVLQIVLWQSALCVLLENGVTIAHSRTSFKDGTNYARINVSGKNQAKSWEAHTETLPWCDGSSLDELTTGEWYTTREGHYLYEPDSCALHRISWGKCQKVSPRASQAAWRLSLKSIRWPG